MSLKIRKSNGIQEFDIRRKGNYFVAYDAKDKKKSYGKINLDTGKFTGDTRCLIILTEMQENNKQFIIDKVLEEIKNDVRDGDLTAIDELLKYVPIKNLKSYLPEIL